MRSEDEDDETNEEGRKRKGRRSSSVCESIFFKVIDVLGLINVCVRVYVCVST